jgi:hypothetical protein
MSTLGTELIETLRSALESTPKTVRLVVLITVAALAVRYCKININLS